jgi:hypothetical protein
MTPRSQPPRKGNSQKVNVRTAVVMMLAPYTATGDAVLLHAGRLRSASSADMAGKTG